MRFRFKTLQLLMLGAIKIDFSFTKNAASKLVLYLISLPVSLVMVVLMNFTLCVSPFFQCGITITDVSVLNGACANETTTCKKKGNNKSNLIFICLFSK